MAAPIEAVYGILRLDAREIAIPAAALQEVIAWPDAIAPLLDARPHLPGTVSRRGVPVPVLDLRRLFGTGEGPGGVLAIIRAGGGRLALAVSGIADVLRVAPGELRPLRRQSPGDGVVACTALIVADAGRRVIEVLDPETLGALPGVALLTGEEASSKLAGADHLTDPLLFFACDGHRFCLPIGTVREVIPRPELEAATAGSAFYRGTLRLRGEVLPVIDLCAVLGLDAKPADNTRLLILRHGGRSIGLPVTAIQAIARCPAADLLDIPGFGLRRPEMVAGLVAAAGDASDQDAILPSPEAIFADTDVLALLRLHDELRGAIATRDARAVGRHAAFLQFGAGQAFAAPIDQVREIIAMPAETLRLGGDGAMLGTLRRRGAIVPLVDLRLLAGIAAAGDASGRRVLMVRGGSTTFGFVVDSTDSVRSVTLRDDIPTDGLPVGGAPPVAAASRIVAIEAEGAPQLMTVLDLAALAYSLEAMRPAA